MTEWNGSFVHWPLFGMRRLPEGIVIVHHVILMGVFRTIVNKLFKKNFDVTFIRNRKSYPNINFFFLSIETFLK